MIVFRSILFNVAFYAFATLILIGWSPALLLPRRATVLGMNLWAGGINKLLPIAGISYEIRGRQHLPAGAVLVASKHQSAWDTIIFHLILNDPAIVLKRELLWIPFYGQYIRRAGMLAVDRDAGARSLKALVAQARQRAAQGRPILIFPEGSRAAPGEKLGYKPGATALYNQLGLPCVPVALNSGLFWPRRRFLRRPGRMVLEFLPPIPAGLPRRQFAARLEATIEEATAKLVAEGQAALKGRLGKHSEAAAETESPTAL